MHIVKSSNSNIRSLSLLKTFGFLLVWIQWILSLQAAPSATLAWDAVPRTDIAGYNLYYGNASRSFTNKVNVGKVTTSTVGNLVGRDEILFRSHSLQHLRFGKRFLQ